MTQRRRNPFLRMVAAALALKAKEGGQISEVLIGLETMIREQVTLRKEITDATNAIAKVQTRHDAIVAELRRLDWTLSSLEDQIAAGQEELASRRRYLGDRLVEAYRSEHTSLLEQVLTDGSFADAMTAAGASCHST